MTSFLRTTKGNVMPVELVFSASNLNVVEE
jgi:hypothetical protein